MSQLDPKNAEIIHVGRVFSPRRYLKFLRFFDPPQVSFHATFQQRDWYRRGRLFVDVIGTFIAIVLLILPATFFIPNRVVVFILYGLSIISLLLLFMNRRGWTNGAGIIMVVTVEIVLGIIIRTTVPFDSFNLPLYDLFCIPILLTAALLPPRAILLVPIFNIAFIFWSLNYQEHTPIFETLLTTGGQFYNALIRPGALQIFLSVISFFWARSILNSLTRAERAEGLAHFQYLLNEQERSLYVKPLRPIGEKQKN